MKFFTKNKVIAGVVGLIAVVSVVNTQAILSLTNFVKGGEQEPMSLFGSKRQEAQVFGSTTNCIRLLPASNNHTTFIDPANFTEDFDGLSKHMFVIGFKIKNTCSRPISIIKDGFTFPEGSNYFQNSKLEDFPNVSAQTASPVYSFSGPNAATISSIYGLLSPDLLIANSNLDGVTPTGDGQMKVANIPANGTKEFIVFSYANASTQNPEHHTRLSLKKIRWFITQSYNDNNLSNTEVKVYELTTPEVEKYTTSYAHFKGDIDKDCAEGAIIGYDANGNPIFCGDDVGENDCAEGAIIGYDATGNPIFCGDQGDDNDCAEGAIIGYDKNGKPIFCQ